MRLSLEVRTRDERAAHKKFFLNYPLRYAIGMRAGPPVAALTR
jgi:hypothetical protein